MKKHHSSGGAVPYGKRAARFLYKTCASLFGARKACASVGYSLALASLAVISVLLFNSHTAAEQEKKDEEKPKVIKLGMKVPDSFWTEKHLFYINGDTVRKTLAEHKGKTLVLDFWKTGCVPCFEHQKSIKEAVSAHRQYLSVVMVNSYKDYDTFGRIDELYQDSFFERVGLTNFESIILDESLSTQFAHWANPTYVWIQGLDGYVQIITYRNLLDKNLIIPFI